MKSMSLKEYELLRQKRNQRQRDYYQKKRIENIEKIKKIADVYLSRLKGDEISERK